MSSTNTNTGKTNEPSTLESIVNSATGAVQSAIGSLTGNTSDKIAGETKQHRADQQYDASHSTLKGPGFTATPSGIAKDHPDRTAGSWNETVGSAKEAVGGLVGSQNLKTSGAQQRVEGEGQQAKGQLSDLSHGVADRVKGSVGSTVAGITNNPADQARYQAQHDQGKTLQRGVEHELQKKDEATKNVAHDRTHGQTNF